MYYLWFSNFYKALHIDFSTNTLGKSMMNPFYLLIAMDEIVEQIQPFSFGKDNFKFQTSLIMNGFCQAILLQTSDLSQGHTRIITCQGKGAASHEHGTADPVDRFPITRFLDNRRDRFTTRDLTSHKAELNQFSNSE